MRGVPADGFDQIGDQVVPPLQLDVDLRPRLLRPVALADEAVERQYDEADEQHRENDEHDDPHALV